MSEVDEWNQRMRQFGKSEPYRMPQSKPKMKKINTQKATDGLRKPTRRQRKRNRQKQREAEARNRLNKPKRKRFASYREYIHSKQWARKRQQAFLHHGKKCAICGTVQDLQVHHLHYRSLYRERMADLQVLCERCHANEHEGKHGWIADPITREYLKMQF
jgi:5-methylcytosine-specific restriction endonuclease McrA